MNMLLIYVYFPQYYIVVFYCGSFCCINKSIKIKNIASTYETTLKYKYTVRYSIKFNKRDMPVPRKTQEENEIKQ